MLHILFPPSNAREVLWSMEKRRRIVAGHGHKGRKLSEEDDLYICYLLEDGTVLSMINTED